MDVGRPVRARIALAVLAALSAGGLRAQMPASPVRYVEARQQSVASDVILPGTVESRMASTVASEVAGLVIELSAREGDTVRRGQPVAKLRRENLELRLAESRADLKETAARLQLAQRSLDRSRELFDSGVVSQQQLDDAASEAEAWQGRMARIEAQIARLEDDLERSRIPAPYNGVVVAEHVAVGEWVDVGDAVVEMVATDELEIVTALPERYFRAVSVGMPVVVTFEALPGLRVEGRVSSIVPRADGQARSFPLKVLVANVEGRIAAGMLARLALAAGGERPATVVPKDAIVRGSGAPVVYVIGEDDTVQAVPVSTGAATGEWIAIEGEVAPGSRVVVRGNERLFPGQKVAPQRLEGAG
jgi:RND family efflux transporter MFP subunit